MLDLIGQALNVNSINFERLDGKCRLLKDTRLLRLYETTLDVLVLSLLQLWVAEGLGKRACRQERLFVDIDFSPV